MAESYTVSQAIDLMGFGPYQLGLSCIMGMAFVADAMEMMILGVLAPALHCHWHISQVQQASLTTVVFLGKILSTTFYYSTVNKHTKFLFLYY